MDRHKHTQGVALGAALLVTSLLSGPIAIRAQEVVRAGPLVSAEWAASHVNDPGLVILHVGSEEAYAAEHLPGARFVSQMAVSDPDSRRDSGLVLELPDPAALEETLEGLGISDDSNILVYAAGGRITPATRVVFTLDWAGLGDRTVLLDGGIEAWKVAGGAVTSEVPAVTGGRLTLNPRAELVVDAEWVQGHAQEDGYALVDGRMRAFFDGVREDRQKAGHIRGAGSLPSEELFGSAGRFKSETDLRVVLEQAGVAVGDTVVAYCHIGQRATAVAFAARLLGHEVKLYDGSWQDWAARDLPAVKAAPGH